MKPFGFTAVHMTQSSHRRSPSSPHASKPKTSRPALHRKGASSANISISKLGRGHTGHSRAPSKEGDSEFDMSAGFLNFWYVSYICLQSHEPCSIFTPKALSLHPAGALLASPVWTVRLCLSLYLECLK